MPSKLIKTTWKAHSCFVSGYLYAFAPEPIRDRPTTEHLDVSTQAFLSSRANQHHSRFSRSVTGFLRQSNVALYRPFHSKRAPTRRHPAHLEDLHASSMVFGLHPSTPRISPRIHCISEVRLIQARPVLAFRFPFQRRRAGTRFAGVPDG